MHNNVPNEWLEMLQAAVKTGAPGPQALVSAVAGEPAWRSTGWGPGRSRSGTGP